MRVNVRVHKQTEEWIREGTLAQLNSLGSSTVTIQHTGNVTKWILDLLLGLMFTNCDHPRQTYYKISRYGDKAGK